MRFLAVQVPEALVDHVVGLLRQAEFVPVLRHQGQHLVAVLARVGQELPELKVVGLLHGSHLVHLQRLLQRVQEGLVLLTHHKSEFLSL